VNRRINKKIYMICVLFVAVGLLVCGLTIAYFSSRDVVTNKHQANDVRILLQEPEWLETGMMDAAVMQPGMCIEKDPKVYNDGESGVYVRMKIIIKCKDENGNFVTVDSNDSRYQAIRNAICVDAAGTQKLLSNETGSVVSHNDAFIYNNDDDWFYYKTESGFTVLEAGTYTSPLFQSFIVPVLKTEYNDLLDSEFRIQIAAQAVSDYYQGDDIMTAFSKNFTEAGENN